MFNWIVTHSLHNRLFVLAFAVIVLLYGGLTAQQMPVDVFPDLNKPTVTIMSEAGGMAPEEVEQLVSFPLETALNGNPIQTVVKTYQSPTFRDIRLSGEGDPFASRLANRARAAFSTPVPESEILPLRATTPEAKVR